MDNHQIKLKELLALAVESQASDLHLTSSYYPTLRIGGKLIPLTKEEKLTDDNSRDLAIALMSDEQRERFFREKEIDFSFDFGEKGRFRVNIFNQKGSVSSALRLIPKQIKTIDDLNLPPILHEFCKPSQGFIFGRWTFGPWKINYLSRLG